MQQFGQTRFYVVEARVVAPRVSLFIGGLPPDLSSQEYSDLLHKAMATKGVTPGSSDLLPRLLLSLPNHSLGFLVSAYPSGGPRTGGSGPLLTCALPCSCRGVCEPHLCLPR